MIIYREGLEHELRFDGTVIASADGVENTELRAYMQLAMGLMSSAKLHPGLVAIAGGLKLTRRSEGGAEREAA